MKPKSTTWVFVAGFVIGAVVLTVLPFMQKKFLKAPAPIRELPQWSLTTASGEAVGSAQLKGRVWLASFVAAPCEGDCVTRQQAFGRSLEHIEDLDGGLVLVSFDAAAALPASGALWLHLGGPGESDVVDAFREGWRTWAGTDAGTSAAEFSNLPGFAVVDQNGALRGFWKDGPEGRGNAINAARLLYQHGAGAER